MGPSFHPMGADHLRGSSDVLISRGTRDTRRRVLDNRLPDDRLVLVRLTEVLQVNLELTPRPLPCWRVAWPPGMGIRVLRARAARASPRSASRARWGRRVFASASPERNVPAVSGHRRTYRRFGANLPPSPRRWLRGNTALPVIAGLPARWWSPRSTSRHERWSRHRAKLSGQSPRDLASLILPPCHPPGGLGRRDLGRRARSEPFSGAASILGAAPGPGGAWRAQARSAPGPRGASVTAATASPPGCPPSASGLAVLACCRPRVPAAPCSSPAR